MVMHLWPWLLDLRPGKGKSHYERGGVKKVGGGKLHSMRANGTVNDTLPTWPVGLVTWNGEAIRKMKGQCLFVSVKFAFEHN